MKRTEIIKIVTFAILLASAFSSAGQQRTIDSLKGLLSSAKQDTNKVRNLNLLSWKLYEINPDTSIILSKEALAISRDLKSEKHAGTSLHQLGVVYWIKGDFERAKASFEEALKIWYRLIPPHGGIRAASTLANFANIYVSQSDYNSARECYLKSLKIAEENGDMLLAASTLGNIGAVYLHQSDYSHALEYLFRSLKLSEKIHDKQKQASALSNIGSVYMYQKNYERALDYYFKGLRLLEELGNKGKMATTFSNIGSIYMLQSDYSRAQENLWKALKMAEELGNKSSIASFANNLGMLFLRKQDYPSALDHFSRALKINEDLGNHRGISLNTGNIGEVYLQMKQYIKARNYLKKAALICDSISTFDNLAIFEKSLYELDRITGNYRDALNHFEKYVMARDIVNNEEAAKKTVQAQMQYDFDKKETANKAEQAKKDLIAAEEKQKQAIIRNSFIVGFLLVLLVAVLVYRGYRNKQKANQIISKQKEEVENAKEIIFRQKLLVEDKQKEILDSIHYARRIQKALMPSEKMVEKNLGRLK